MASLLLFMLGENQCAFPVTEIQEVLPMVALSPIPGQGPPLEGMLNLRGVLLPVVDLRSCFGLAQTHWNGKTRIIVVKTQGARVGVVVDQIEDVVEAEGGEVIPPAGEGREMVAEVRLLRGKALAIIRPERLAAYAARCPSR